MLVDPQIHYHVASIMKTDPGIYYHDAKVNPGIYIHVVRRFNRRVGWSDGQMGGRADSQAGGRAVRLVRANV